VCRGSQALEQLLPGLLGELAAAGAPVVDDGDLSRVYTRHGSYELNRSGKFADPAALVQYLPSRPLLEFHTSGSGSVPCATRSSWTATTSLS
jgi:hypothetical protein